MSADAELRLVSRERDLFGPLEMGLFVGSIAASCALSMAVSEGLALVPAVSLGLLAWWATPRVGRGEVRVEASEFLYTLDGQQRRVPIAHVASAWNGTLVTLQGPPNKPAGTYTPGSTPAVVVQLRDRSTLRFGVRDQAEAEALLRALGRDPKSFRTAFKGRRIFHSVLFWIAGLPVAGAVTVLIFRTLIAFSWVPSGRLVLGLFAVVTLALRAAVRPHLDVEVGTNGLLDRTRAFGRFLPWSEVAAVKLGDGALLFELRGGTRRRLWCNPEDGTVLPAVFARVTEALAAWQRSAQAGDPLTVLDRNGRTIAQWRADLATLLGGTGYREQVIDRARLEAVFADPATPLERRVGAALALAHHDPAATPTRVRVVAEGNADPTERDLLLRLADGTADDDVLESALRAR